MLALISNIIELEPAFSFRLHCEEFRGGFSGAEKANKTRGIFRCEFERLQVDL